MTVSRLIYLSIFLILVLFSITTFINLRESGKVAENAQYLANSSNVVRLGSKFQRNILNMERGLRGYLITNERYFLKGYDSPKVENQSLVFELTQLLKNDTSQLYRLKSINQLYNKWIEEYAEKLKNVKAKDFSNLVDDEYLRNNSVIIEEVGVNKELQRRFNELVNKEYKSQVENKEILIRSEEHTKGISILLTCITIALVISIAIILERQISARLKKMIKMTDSIGEGNYKVYVPDSQNDELSELTQSLNHMTQMLDQHVSLLERKNDELDQFANVVSHDLKAPLRGIENVVTWIEEDHHLELSPKVQEYILLIKGRILRAEKLIEGILKFARIGKENHDKERVDVKELILDVIDILPKKSGITVEIQENMPVLVTEKVPLQQIFANLIGNAIKYHNSSGFIKVYYLEQANNYRFFVEDNGPGIDKIYHEKIFVIFQTLTENDSYENTGIGLAIVKKILDDRKEQIKIESEPGRGTTFSFTWSKY